MMTSITQQEINHLSTDNVPYRTYALVYSDKNEYELVMFKATYNVYTIIDDDDFLYDLLNILEVPSDGIIDIIGVFELDISNIINIDEIMPNHVRKSYGPKQIAKELLETAQGETYHGNALYVAVNIPVLTDEERWVIMRWLDGAQCVNDYRELQLIAHKIASDV